MRAEIEIPEGVQVNVDGLKVSVTGPKGKVEREFKTGMVKIKVEGNKVVLETPRDTKKFKKMLNTIKAHIRNMILGVTRGFRYKLAVVYVHFPMRIKVQGNEIIVENFLGEKAPRKTWKYPDVQVKVDMGKKEIIVEGCDIEHVGQTAANLEMVTRIRAKDRRVFRDGIFLVERGFADG